MRQPQYRALRKLLAIKYAFYYVTSVIMSFGNVNIPVYVRACVCVCVE